MRRGRQDGRRRVRTERAEAAAGQGLCLLLGWGPEGRTDEQTPYLTVPQEESRRAPRGEVGRSGLGGPRRARHSPRVGTEAGRCQEGSRGRGPSQMWGVWVWTGGGSFTQRQGLSSEQPSREKDGRMG